MKYYYLEDGQVKGPLSVAQLEQLFFQDIIGMETLIAAEGSEDWAAYSAMVRTNFGTKRSVTAKKPTKEAPKKQPVICAIFNFLGYLCFASAVLYLLSGIMNRTEAEDIFNAIGSGLGGLFWLALSAYIKKKCY